ncbi:MAG: flagellar biosynthesis protein FliO [Thermoleophilia bacterium]|nr:flagellar biosynthesis protein FliO [Thermoleophilia bacterium]
MKRTTPLRSLLAALVVLALLVAVPIASAADAAATTKPATTTGATSAAEAKAKVKAQEESAAKRRAASSEFEREKLDQGAFQEDEKAAKGGDKGSGSNSGGSALRFIFGLAVVLGAIYGVHWLLKKWGQSRLQGVAGRTGVIDVVATTPLAQGRALHLVRVGDELVLVGATDQSITRIGDVDATLFAQSQGNAGNGEFQAMLSGALLGNQPGVPQGMGGAGSADQPFIKRFLDNLRLSTAR